MSEELLSRDASGAIAHIRAGDGPSAPAECVQCLRAFDRDPTKRVAILHVPASGSSADVDAASFVTYIPRKPVIAAIAGPLAGAMFDVVMASCGVRLATADATFSAGPRCAVTEHLASGMPDIAYPLWAALYLAGERFDAEEALRISLVNEVVEPLKLDHAAEEIARKAAQILPRALVLEEEGHFISRHLHSQQLVQWGFGVYVLAAHRKHSDQETREVAYRRRPNRKSAA